MVHRPPHNGAVPFAPGSAPASNLGLPIHPAEPDTPPSSPHLRPEKSNVRRSRPPVWEMMSTDQDESQQYHEDGVDGAVVRRDQSTGVATRRAVFIQVEFTSHFCKGFRRPSVRTLFYGPHVVMLNPVYRRIRR